MGDCIYVAEDGMEPGRFRQVGHPVVRAIPSEQWMDPAETGRILAEDHFLNTSTGVWFYEADLLHEPEKLQERLRALAEHIGTPAFVDAYQRARAASRAGSVAVWRPKS